MSTLTAHTKTDSLRINEIFYSIQGESTKSGLPTVFIRLTGCPLRCTYCDTAYAFHHGTRMSLDAIVLSTARHGTQHVCVTGGEPLAQPQCLVLMQRLCDLGYQVSLETSGALPIAAVDARVCRIMDLKTPQSGELKRNLYENLAYLTAHDQLKMVVCNYQDYQWCRHFIETHPNLPCDILLSPSAGQLCTTQLAEWILRDRLNVRLQIQLHKILWDNQPGR